MSSSTETYLAGLQFEMSWNPELQNSPIPTITPWPCQRTKMIGLQGLFTRLAIFSVRTLILKRRLQPFGQRLFSSSSPRLTFCNWKIPIGCSKERSQKFVVNWCLEKNKKRCCVRGAHQLLRLPRTLPLCDIW